MSDKRLTTNRVYPKVSVVSVGDMETGFSWYGPFSDDREAVVWIKANVAPNTLTSIIHVNVTTSPEETT